MSWLPLHSWGHVFTEYGILGWSFSSSALKKCYAISFCLCGFWKKIHSHSNCFSLQIMCHFSYYCQYFFFAFSFQEFVMCLDMNFSVCPVYGLSAYSADLCFVYFLQNLKNFLGIFYWMHFYLCYGLSVCALPKFRCWNPNS